MLLHPFAADADEFAKTLELRRIRKAAELVDSVVFFILEMDERPVFLREALLVVIAHDGRRHAAGIMVAAVQPRLVDDAGFFEHLSFLLDDADPVALAGQVQRRIAAEDAAAGDEKVVCFGWLDGIEFCGFRKKSIIKNQVS